MQPNRREFVSVGTGLAAAGLAALASIDELLAEELRDNGELKKTRIEPGNTILFQGDSITDAGRNRNLAGNANSMGAMGNGYAWLAATQLLVDSPAAGLKVFNRGISGNKVYQLADRWQTDCLDLKPDLLSILIGVNDFWHKLEGQYDGTVEKYEKDYRALVKRTKNAMPKVKLIICEPFVLRVGSVNDAWFPAFDGYRAAARRVADDGGATFVPFQSIFDLAAKIAPPEYWAADGVHPTINGAALMAHVWLRATAA